MDLLKMLLDAFKEIGAGGTALLLIFSFVGWVAVKLVPPAIERTAVAFERIAESIAKLEFMFYSHTGDAVNISQSVNKIHSRLDTIALNLPTREDITNIGNLIKAEGELTRAAVQEHTKACQHQAERFIDKLDAYK